MQRRSFFTAILAPVVALVVPRAAKANQGLPRLTFDRIGPSIEAECEAVRQQWATNQERINIIQDAMIMLGLLSPGQCACGNDIALAEREIARHHYIALNPLDVATWLAPYYGTMEYVSGRQVYARHLKTDGWADPSLMQPGDTFTISNINLINPDGSVYSVPLAS